MSDLQPKIPSAEKPRDSADESISLEESTLDKQAKSATFRDAHERLQHLASLNSRIDVLQAKLNATEQELLGAVPRIAELEQATKTSSIAAFTEVLGVGGGAILLAVASFCEDDRWKYGLLGLGVGASLIGLSSKLLYSLFGWPKKKQASDYTAGRG